MNSFGAPPDVDELEVSVIGPGYGEAIVIHVGGNQWILVDSCRISGSQNPAPLEYLEALGVNYQEAVKQIVISHWDQDHVALIDSLVGACSEAQVVMSEALLTKEFLGLADLHTNSPSTSGLESIARVVQLLEVRKSRHVRFNSPIWAVANTTLFNRAVEVGELSVPVRLIALSPASATLMQAKWALIEHISEAVKERRRVAFNRANKASVAVWLEVGFHHILLGADLEDSPHENEGWKAIVSGAVQLEERADMFKVPHHGSENAHNDDVWSKLLEPEPYAVVTPWFLAGNYLPRPEDIKRILSFTSSVYLTAPHPKKSKLRDRGVNRSFQEAIRSSDSLYGRWGHVRLRRQITEPNSSWSVEVFGGARLLTSE